ncbi:expressed unknown protein [Seminavis robusta]|uniref:Alcohol dehydrogenase iron-type/glycerol dehydrogenase GldA domain-containing protein n=1 Tax=Seminavis robusta TaxID=568900 RepID=A0A9N8E909_9STRA|nr:expressed unknown protein [Seminavis robusta]|eukprot:Sro759_g198190.1 n/a (360) ;mRNA; f:16506-17585
MQRNIIQGLKKFGGQLKENREVFGATPILVVESALRVPKSTGKRAAKKEEPSQLSQHVQLLLGSSGLRSTSTRPSTDHFPFQEDVNQTAAFAQRLGASTIIGVGGTAALELAKSVAQESSNFEELVLVPGTDGATLLTATSHPLLTDPEQNALIPGPASLRDDLGFHLVLPELNRSKTDPQLTAVYSSLVLGLDAIYRRDSDDKECITMIQSAATILEHVNDGSLGSVKDTEIQDLMLWAGSRMLFGVDSGSYRSIPLALTCSLIPTTFSSYSFGDFMSCLLPGVLSLLEEKDEYKDLALEISSRLGQHCPRLENLQGGAVSINALLAQVQTTADLWDCQDAPDAQLEKVLSVSLESNR